MIVEFAAAPQVDPALVRHFERAARVRIAPVIDPEEITRERIDGILAGRFEFNGRTHCLDDPARPDASIDWLTNPDADVEWHILLHKFYFAVGLARRWRDAGDAACLARWRDLIDGWIAVVPPGFIAPDVTGRRVQNWIYSLYIVLGSDVGRAARVLDAAFLQRLNDSIAAQVDYLCEHLTPKRNHRTLELLAIFLGGVMFPEHPRAAFWRGFALEQTVANARADLLPDGVHCELSTDYHHLALRNWMQVRTLAAANDVPVPAALDGALLGALEFSLHVHNPAGIVPSFSDGDARSYLALLEQGAQLFDRADMRFVATAGRQGRAPTDRFVSFDASGYHVVRSEWAPRARFEHAQHLVFDCGPLGEGNHGHFDALSFELFANGRPLVVDPGRFTYSEAVDPIDGCNWRVRFRSTAAHNTVVVDGRSQTRYEPRPAAAGTRHATGTLRHRIAGPEPVTRLVERASGAMLDLLHGRCESRAYDVVHDRAIVFVERRYWIVDDRLRAPQPHDYRLRFQLSPEAGADAGFAFDCAGGRSMRLRARGLDVVQHLWPDQDTRLLDSWVSPRYGCRIPAPALETSMRASSGRFSTVLVPRADDTSCPSDVGAFVTTEAATSEDGRESEVLRIDLGDGRIDRWFLDLTGAAGEWRSGAHRFSARWLFWREADDGSLLSFQSHPGAHLRAAGSQCLRQADALR